MKVGINKDYIPAIVTVLLVFVLLPVLYIGLKQIGPISDIVNLEEIFRAILVIVILLLCLAVYQSLTIRLRVTRLASYMTEEISLSQKLFLELYQNSPIPYVLINHRGIQIRLPFGCLDSNRESLKGNRSLISLSQRVKRNQIFIQRLFGQNSIKAPTSIQKT